MKKILLFLMFALFCIPWAANAQQSLPYSYGFENNNLATDGWTTQNPSGLNASEFGIIGTAAQNGSYGFRFSSYSDRGESTQYLISPELVAPNGVIVQFYYTVSSSYTDGETFQVGYSTTDDNISSFTFGSEINATNTSWEQTEELVFPAGTKYVAVYYSANYQYRLYVDDFSFTAAPSCLKPTLSNEVILSMENASVQWTENGTATNWELQYSTNADFSGATTINRSGIPAYAISDLSAATTYYARVRANCGGGDYSDWSNVISFTTWSCEQPTVVEYDLADSYGDGWNGNAIQIFDGCGDLVETLTIASGYSNSGTLDLCGDYYQFVWVSGSYANETSFTLTVGGTAIYSQQSGNDFTDGQELHAIGIQPPVKPTALTAGTPSANEVQLSWTENGTATTWQICINDDENNLVVANSNPFTLTGLNAVTAYTVKVRSTDGTSASCWSNVVSFTTDSQCPTPNGLNVTNLMPTSATLNWQGEADSYNVRYGVAGGEVAVFEDGFENGLENWTIISNGAYTGTTWQQFNVDEFGNEGLTNHNGSYVTMSRSWGGNSVGDVSVDNWLITPQVALDGDLKYWVINDDGNGYAEQYAIYVSTTSNSISDFTLLYTPQNDATTWTEHVVDLRSFNGALGYIAIRHNDYGKDFLFIDDFGIFATQEAGEWTYATSTTNSLDITGLTSEVNYVFQVQADCGTEGESGWSASATFTTPDVCTEPTDLTAEVTGTAAKLSWTGVNDMYNLQYCEVDPTVPATIILNVPTDIWQDGTGYQMLLDADATAYGDVFTATSGWTATDYSAFEYLIPTDAECSADATHIVLENSVSIQIPAGTYDWCIVNPSPADSKIYIAASNGNVGGRQDDYVFEPGMTYEFTPSLYGSNDGIDVTVTDNNAWTLVEGVTNPYTLTNLNAQTTYKYQVQGVDCDGNGNPTDWSESATFITAEEIYTVYFNAGTGTCSKDTMQGAGALPTAESCEGYTLAGWAESPVNTAESAPTGLYTDTYTPTGNVVLYAVYVNASGTEWSSFPACNVIEIPYFTDFETSAPGYQAGDPGNGRTYVKPAGWTIVSQTPLTTRRARPQIFYTSSYAHSGNFSLRLDSAAVTAMPRLSDDIDVSELKMEFYVRQPNAGQYLEVGVMTDLADPGSFVSVATIDNSTSAVTHWYVDFGGYENNSAEHHYIAFRNSGATNRSINNIDDISLYMENPCELSLSDLPYTETFDSVTEITSPVRTGVQPECWVVAHQYESLTNTTKPQVFYTPSYANSGNYSLRMEGRCIYAMPKLAEDVDVRALHMELYLRQPNASQQLEVGVMSNLNDEGTFVSVATISNSGTGVEYKLIDFSGYSGTGKYIAFRNSVVGGGTGKSINNIDDISLYVENPCEVSLGDLPYTETFDNVTEITSTDRTGEQPECWTVAHRYTQLTNTTKPQVFYTSSYAHSGSYSLRMEGQCIYAMPKLAEDIDVSMLQMELYVRQPYADQQLEVGVMSNLNDPTTFQTVLTINTTPRVVEQVVFDFSEYSGTGKYIAFRNSVVGDGTGKSINNIDDITLSLAEAKIAEVSSENVIDANSVERYLEDIRVYPNPTTGNLYINAMDVQKVECYNQMGQLVGVYDNANELNISDLSNGVYMLRITVPQGVTMRKVVKK